MTGVSGEKFVCFKADSINPNLKGVCRDMWVCRGNSKWHSVHSLPTHKNDCGQLVCLLMTYNGFLLNLLCISGISTPKMWTGVNCLISSPRRQPPQLWHSGLPHRWHGKVNFNGQLWVSDRLFTLVQLHVSRYVRMHFEMMPCGVNVSDAFIPPTQWNIVHLQENTNPFLQYKPQNSKIHTQVICVWMFTLEL